MGAPTSDRGGIQQSIRALRDGGWDLDYVNDGEEEILVDTEPAAIDAVMAVDQAWLHVKRREANGVVHAEGYVFFVLGNDPDEVICDYTVNLEDVVGPLVDGWIQ